MDAHVVVDDVVDNVDTGGLMRRLPALAFTLVFALFAGCASSSSSTKADETAATDNAAPAAEAPPPAPAPPPLYTDDEKALMTAFEAWGGPGTDDTALQQAATTVLGPDHSLNDLVKSKMPELYARAARDLDDEGKKKWVGGIMLEGLAAQKTHKGKRPPMHLMAKLGAIERVAPKGDNGKPDDAWLKDATKKYAPEMYAAMLQFACKASQSSAKAALKSFYVLQESHRAETDSYYLTLEEIPPDDIAFLMTNDRFALTLPAATQTTFTAQVVGRKDPTVGDTWTISETNELVHAVDACGEEAKASAPSK